MTAARVISVNVGQSRLLRVGDREVPSGIFKSPVAEGARLEREGFAGDVQADRRVHGGPEQAAYAYPSEHYAHWRAFLGDADLPWGYFGENLSVEGLLESDVAVGEVLRMGDARVRVTRPRGPCSKLAARVGRPHFVAEFLETGRLGFYLSVVDAGVVRPGDAIERLERPHGAVTMAELIAALHAPEADPRLLERVAAAPHVAEKHRQTITTRLDRARAR
jgi:MOSC domain-containing protein YiiM